MSPFRQYSAFYDLLYRDKDYAAEADYVAEALRRAAPQARTILELGSGTGRHGRLLASAGFAVYGVERSTEMVSLAHAAQADARSGAGSFGCEIGDICSIDIGRTFDAVISLFHVISYQTTNDALLAAFASAAKHLKPGGVFLFDVWHGPAVLTERPEARVKEVSDGRHSVKRTARPVLDTNAATVKVTYDIDGSNLQSGERAQFTEEHLMRYLFPTETDLLARASDLRVVGSEEFLTGNAPSPGTWGVMYLLKK